MQIIETRYHNATDKKTARMSASFASVVGKRKGKIHFDVVEGLTMQQMSDLAVQKFLDAQEGEQLMTWHRTAATSHGGYVYVSHTEVVNFVESQKQGVDLADEVSLPTEVTAPNMPVERVAPPQPPVMPMHAQPFMSTQYRG